VVGNMFCFGEMGEDDLSCRKILSEK